MFKYVFHAAAIAILCVTPSVAAAQSLTRSEPIATIAAETEAFDPAGCNACLWTYAESYRREDFSVITIPIPVYDPEANRNGLPALPIAIVPFPVVHVGEAWLDYARGCCSACSGNQYAVDLLQTIFLSVGEQLRCIEGIVSHT